MNSSDETFSIEYTALTPLQVAAFCSVKGTQQLSKNRIAIALSSEGAHVWTMLSQRTDELIKHFVIVKEREYFQLCLMDAYMSLILDNTVTYSSRLASWNTDLTKGIDAVIKLNDIYYTIDFTTNMRQVYEKLQNKKKIHADYIVCLEPRARQSIRKIMHNFLSGYTGDYSQKSLALYFSTKTSELQGIDFTVTKMSIDKSRQPYFGHIQSDSIIG